MVTMSLLGEKYGVCRLDRGTSIPSWAYEGEFFSITRTAEELSVLCLETNIPEGVKAERSWRVLKVEGPLDFSLIGILSKISSVLAQQNISIFAVSTYDTDYILVKDEKVERAVEALREQGYEVNTK